MTVFEGSSIPQKISSVVETILGFNGSFTQTPRGRIWIHLHLASGIGILAALLSVFLDPSIRFEGVAVGDIGPPIVAIKMLLDGESPYALSLRNNSIALYPFTTSVILSPLLLLPAKLWAPVFSGICASLLSAAVLWKGKPWQLLIFLTPCYFTAVHSVQWSPVMATSLLLPPLLPIAVAKPQIGVILVLCGRWSRRTLLAAVCITLVSLAVFPTWPVEWLRNGRLDQYLGVSPITVFPGFLLISTAILWRTPAARLVLAMSLVQQRFYYDQLLLFLVPKTAAQMVTLVISSWAGFAVFWMVYPTGLRSGEQYGDVWTIVLLTLYIPALAIVWFNHWHDRRRGLDSNSNSGSLVSPPDPTEVM